MSRPILVVAASVLLPLLWFFCSVLVSGEVLLFRDAAHFYYPLFEWCCGEWSQGRIPLWNPDENGGIPVLADSTSSVLYPGKLLFAIPGLSFPHRYGIYIVAHVLWAAVTAYCLGRELGVSILAAGLCGVSYAFSGSVLFQVYNVVFLVGAAWLPLALLAAWRMLRRRSWIWAANFAAVLAMMTFGGDAQAAYHAGLCAAVLAWLLWLNDRFERGRRSEDSAESDSVGRPGQLRRTPRLVILAAAALFTFALSSAQVLPSIQWTRRSERVLTEVPRTVYEIPKIFTKHADAEQHSWGRLIWQGIFAEPPAGTHHQHIYDFSLPPWHVLELWWPNVSGQLFPIHRRWTNVIPAEGRTWVPSLYMGILPIVLACLALSRRAPDVRDRWFRWLVVLSFAGAIGWYGLGFFVHEIRCGLFGSEPDDVLFGQPVGGLYWLLVSTLPGYVYFRFPAKWTIVLALGISVLAARSWDHWREHGHRRLPVALAAVAAMSFVLFVLTQLFGDSLIRPWLSTATPDDTFGPLDVAGAMVEMRHALLHSMIFAVMLCACFLVRGHGSQMSRNRMLVFVLAITTVDLCLAQRMMLQTAPPQTITGKTALSEKVGEGTEASTQWNGRLYRGSTQRWTPGSWRTQSSPDRQKEIARWDRATAFPKYPLLDGHALVEAYGTMTSHNFLTFMQVAKQLGPARQDQVREPHRRILDLLGARFLVLPEGTVYPARDGLLQEGALVEDAVLWSNPASFPRAWIVHHCQQLPVLDTIDPGSLRKRAEEVLIDGGQMRDLREVAVVESTAPIEPFRPEVKQTAARESCQVQFAEPQRILLDAHLLSDGLIVLSDLYFPGWTADVTDKQNGETRRVAILRCNRMMRGVRLAAGNYRIEFRYRPRRFYVGATISIASWLILAGCLWVHARRRLTRRVPIDPSTQI